MARTTVHYHIRHGEHIEVDAQGQHCFVLRFGSDEVLDDLVLFADPAVMVELLNRALTGAQSLLDSMSPQSDASRPGPGTRSVKRSVSGAGASAALPESCMAEGG